MLQDGQALPSARLGWGRGQHDPNAFSRDGQPLQGRVLPIALADAEPPGAFSGTPGALEPGAFGGGSAERVLLDGARRAVRTPGDRVALVLHLSRLASPAPQPHHRRIARALLTEAAQRHDGQLFALGNGDLVLLCRSAHSPAGTPSLDDGPSLRTTLARLFGGETPEPEAMVSLWRLAEQADILLAYAAERLGAAERFGAPDRFGATLQRDAAERIKALSLAIPPEPARITALLDFPDLLQRRTGALISKSGGTRPHSFRPLFREIAFSPPALEARYGPANEANPDPWILRHFVRRLDEPLLALIEAALPGSGPVGMAGTPPDFSLHLNLSTQVIAKERCQHVLDLCRSIGVPIGIEVSLVEAATAPGAFAAARDVLRRSGFRIVLGGISHQALLLVRPQSLGVDLLKLEWSPRLSRLAEPDRGALASALAAIGMERVILDRADNEEAVLWGLGHGIRRFVGHHVEMMLAAGRMLTCAAASGCTLGQCSERAGSITAAGRRFCRNLALLDSAAPATGQA